MHAQQTRFVLSDYVDEAVREATYDKLDDGRGRFLTHFEGRKREVMSNKERM